MSETWAKSASQSDPADASIAAPPKAGVDLHLDLPGLRGSRVRAGLEAALRDAIRTGRLGPGTRLPSSRALAADLGLARNTVAEVYGQLIAEGWLTARTGSGTLVAERTAAGPGPGPQARPEVAAPRYDLRPGVPDLSAFPSGAWLATARKVLATAPRSFLDYAYPRGLPRLRTALAGSLARTRGVTADPSHIVICAGFAHGLSVTCAALRAAGAATLAVEAYGHQAHRNLAQGQGLHPRRRREAARWGARWGGVIIEDDYDGEFRYDRQPVGALQALAPDHVIYAGTASKSLIPALRLGWLVVPPRLLDAVAAQLTAGPSGLDQLILADFIDSGDYDRQVRRTRLAYRRRRDRLAAALSAQRRHVTGIAAGLHAVLDLPATDTEDRLISRAAEHGLALRAWKASAPRESTPTARAWSSAMAAHRSTPTPRPWPGSARSWNQKLVGAPISPSRPACGGCRAGRRRTRTDGGPRRRSAPDRRPIVRRPPAALRP
jgi:GntR family transcriptional regulator/MocR family aminotransferase